jgi:hypothetical protein
MRKALENLPKRHAYLKILGKHGAVQLKNITLPSTSSVDQPTFDRVKREFRLRLMRPVDKIVLPHYSTQLYQTQTSSPVPASAYLRAYS